MALRWLCSVGAPASTGKARGGRLRWPVCAMTSSPAFRSGSWRGLMAHIGPGERTPVQHEPIDTVDYHLDMDYVGDGIRAHRLDVMVPHRRHRGPPLPVYVYFHGGGWTSGDKSPLTKYCASQALAGMVVVNVNYRMATTFRMRHMLHDANTALDWVHREIAGYGGDPDNIVLGGDSAGGHIAAMLTATATRPELAGHYDLVPSAGLRGLRGLVQHCSIVDISVIFERGFILSLNFIRMLLPASLSAGVGEQTRRRRGPPRCGRRQSSSRRSSGSTRRFLRCSSRRRSATTSTGRTSTSSRPCVGTRFRSRR